MSCPYRTVDFGEREVTDGKPQGVARLAVLGYRLCKVHAALPTSECVSVVVVVVVVVVVDVAVSPSFFIFSFIFTYKNLKQELLLAF